MSYTVDWKIESNYPDPKTASPPVWAWEFLRRNPAYCADWEFYASQVRAAAKRAGHPNNALFAEFYLSFDDAAYKWYRLNSNKKTYLHDLEATTSVFTAPHSEPITVYRLPRNESTAAPHETNGTCFWRNVNTNDLGALRSVMGEAWGLHFLLSPRVAINQIIHDVMNMKQGFIAVAGKGCLLMDYSTEYLHNLSGDELKDYALSQAQEMDSVFGDPSRIVVSFDLSLPLEPQLVRVKRLVKQKAAPLKPKRRHEPEHYRDYLRTYDARMAGVKYLEIGRLLMPNRIGDKGYRGHEGDRSTLSMWYDAAKRLVNTDYIAVSLSIKKPKRTRK